MNKYEKWFLATVLLLCYAAMPFLAYGFWQNEKAMDSLQARIDEYHATHGFGLPMEGER